ncbi:LysR family transcriptional regulator [Frondihabitans cladoniiphilus]|uniref:LysR family transcriptional regulator n=1 Tax=Frondihabitans cladoniiphilus TaxID=715785 RepID=A0ABP8W4Q9_9MICO
MLDLRRLEILHRFASLGSISAVAADMGYSPSAISQSLATLEKEVGIALLERTAQRANLTDAGRVLVGHAGPILDAVEAAQSEMLARAGTVAGRVDLSTIPGLAVTVAPFLAEVQRVHPALTVVAHEIDSTQAAAAVLDGRSDLAIVDDWNQETTEVASGLDVHLLRREPVVLAVPAGHELASRRSPVTVAVLRRLLETDTLLCAPLGQLSRTATDERLRSIGAAPVQRWEFEGLQVLASLVAAASGVALLPLTIADAEPGVVALELVPRMHRRVLAATRNTIRHDPAIQACLDASRRAFEPRDG